MTENLFDPRIAAFDENYPRILQRLEKAAARAGKNASQITLLAATKTVPLPVVQYAIEKGIRCVGENRVQELLEKSDGLDRTKCDVQLIGRLQTNKVKFLPGRVSCIQSVDSLRLAREISRQFGARGETAHILVEVNIGREESKGGVLPEALAEFIDQVRELEHISVRGLMAIPPAEASERELAKYFSAMHQYYVDITAKKMDNVSMEFLSMGMSADFELAVECGSNMVRIGSALFGARNPQAGR